LKVPLASLSSAASLIIVVVTMRCSLVVVLLLAALLCSAGQAGAEVRAVKLCGREFLRAVVYTCGGSRWRRLLPEPDTEGEPPPNLLSSSSPQHCSASNCGRAQLEVMMDGWMLKERS